MCPTFAVLLFLATCERLCCRGHLQELKEVIRDRHMCRERFCFLNSAMVLQRASLRNLNGMWPSGTLTRLRWRNSQGGRP